MKTTAEEKVQRRTVLKGTAVAGAAIGSGVLSTELLAETREAPEPVNRNRGYRETDHIRDYYRLARF